MTEEGQVLQAAGKDVETAIEAGLERLDVDRDAVEVEVLDEGRRGVLGLGARAARVRLKVAPLPTAKRPAAAERAPEPTPEKQEEKTEEEKEIQVVRRVMDDLLTTMDLGEAQVEVRRAEPGPNDDKVPPLVVDVRGPGTDVLIDRDGEALDALQYIARLLVGREMKAWVHVVVDVQGYKATRAERLRKLARRMADQAVDSDRTVILEPMPPHERRVVHVALHDDSRVGTESIYEGERRRVTIFPEDRSDD